jgi:hypothetical protein
MGISPGTERSITRIAELMPRLEQSMSELADIIKTATGQALIKPDGPRCEDVPLAIALTDDEWIEVANAAQLKAERLRKDELPNEDMTAAQLDEWAATLESAYKKITAVLDKNCITY